MLKRILLPGPFSGVFHSKNACARRCQRRGEQNFSLGNFVECILVYLICGDRVRCEMHAAFLASWQCAQVHTWITAVDFTFFSFALFFPLSRNLVVYLGADTMHAKSLHPPYDSTLSSIPRRGLVSLRRYYSVLINVNRPTTMSRYFQPSVATPINYSNSLCLLEIKTSSV